MKIRSVLYLALIFRYSLMVYAQKGELPPSIGQLKSRIESLDKNQAAQWEYGQPVTSYVGFYIESLSSIKPSEMAFDVDLYLRQTWQDHRLVHNSSRHINIQDHNLVAKHIWVPDLIFANAKKSAFQDVLLRNQMFIIYPDGHLHLSTRIISTIACNLNLKNYPLDTQECVIYITSYNHPEAELILKWFPSNPIKYNKGIEMPEMTIVAMEADTCRYINYTFGQTETGGLVGNFSCLAGKIKFARSIGYHLVQTYIPTVLIVMISWLSFWIDPSAIPARISLSFTTLLTLATMAAGIRNSLPPVSYAKAIDYWIGLCTFFIFAALLEFALVNSHMRMTKVEVYTGGMEKDELSLLENGPINNNRRRSQGSLLKEKQNQSRAHKIDLVSRFLFPLSFIGFNIVYWLTYIRF